MAAATLPLITFHNRRPCSVRVRITGSVEVIVPPHHTVRIPCESPPEYSDDDRHYFSYKRAIATIPEDGSYFAPLDEFRIFNKTPNNLVVEVNYGAFAHARDLEAGASYDVSTETGTFSSTLLNYSVLDASTNERVEMRLRKTPHEDVYITQPSWKI
jgi:hypothetical protein